MKVDVSKLGEDGDAAEDVFEHSKSADFGRSTFADLQVPGWRLRKGPFSVMSSTWHFRPSLEVSSGQGVLGHFLGEEVFDFSEKVELSESEVANSSDKAEPSGTVLFAQTL